MDEKFHGKPQIFMLVCYLCSFLVVFRSISESLFMGVFCPLLEVLCVLSLWQFRGRFGVMGKMMMIQEGIIYGTISPFKTTISQIVKISARKDAQTSKLTRCFIIEFILQELRSSMLLFSCFGCESCFHILDFLELCIHI